jgi:hypothetical protein
MVRMCGVGGASGGEGVLVVELGHVDMFRKDEMTKMVSLIRVRSYFFRARGYFHVLRLIPSIFLAVSTDTAHRSCGRRFEFTFTFIG